MDGPWQYHPKWNKSDEKDPIHVIHSYAGYEKQTNEQARQKQTHGYREQRSG